MLTNVNRRAIPRAHFVIPMKLAQLRARICATIPVMTSGTMWIVMVTARSAIIHVDTANPHQVKEIATSATRLHTLYGTLTKATHPPHRQMEIGSNANVPQAQMCRAIKVPARFATRGVQRAIICLIRIATCVLKGRIRFTRGSANTGVHRITSRMTSTSCVVLIPTNLI